MRFAMKKVLILILIALLLALTMFVAINGVQIGKLEILGVTGIQDRNSELEEKIAQATKLASTDYKKAVSTVQENSKKLEEEKKKYEDMTAISTDSEIQEAAQLQTYEIEYLWAKIGNHATSEGATIKMEVTKGTNTTTSTYNLKFTVTGTYISITDFISDIENDSSLGFKIEEFKMLPGNGSDLEATFVCKDIAIKDLSQEVITQNNDENNTNTTNRTNSTNTTNTTNTTNSTNTNTSNTTNNTNTSNSTNVAGQ